MPAATFTALPQSGSSRVNYIAESSAGKFIVTQNENLRENDAFFYFSKVFENLNLNTPKIFAVSEDQKIYVQEYLGSATLSEIIADEGNSDKVRSLVKQSLDRLFELQTATNGKIDYSKTFEYEKYDELPVLNDLFYFKNMFVDFLEIEYHKSSLLKEFKKIVSEIEKIKPKGLMIRDFQSRNIMVNNDGSVFFIDYQSAMNGPLIYDVVSFLFQAKANFSEDFRNEMLEYYISKFPEQPQIDLINGLKPVQLVRYLQVLGAYGFRGLIQKKPHFISSIAQGIDNLSTFTQNWDGMNNFPELSGIIHKLKSAKTAEKIEKILKS